MRHGPLFRMLIPEQRTMPQYRKKRENSPSVHRIPADGRNRKKERIAINILPHPGKKYCHISYPKSEQFMSGASLFPVKQKTHQVQ